MQEDSPVQNENTPDIAAEQPQRPGRRRRPILLGAAVLTALGVAGVA
ncbi:M23 family peptidase, partial [Micromonospora sp. STR1_7]|nr:M23 family peptidase [Micromonospora parastrephiae]